MSLIDVVRRRSGVAALLLVLGVLAAGCQPATSATSAGAAATSGAAGSPTASSTPDATPAQLSFSPADKATGVKPTDPVTVSASSGTLTSVTLVDDKGAAVAGVLDGNGTWTAKGSLLRPSATYTLTAKATGPDGTASTVTSSFTTLTPKVTATYSLIPNGGTVGVGMPVSIQFDSPVATKAERAEVEKRVKVTTVPAQVGAWGWLDNRQLMWRPQVFWKPGTKVNVSAPLHGVQTGPDKWVGADTSTSFTIGDAMISTVDMHAHTLTVRRNGAVLRTFKVSTGRPGPLTETRYGTKVIIERNREIIMDSATVGIPKGDPNYYRIKTQWNLRLTWTGEFIHSAPWSVNAQGSENVSHGCTNMAPADAEWMFSNSRMGDVVKFTGSTRPFLPTEGIGVWVYSFTDWKAQSALV